MQSGVEQSHYILDMPYTVVYSITYVNLLFLFLHVCIHAVMDFRQLSIHTRFFFSHAMEMRNHYPIVVEGDLNAEQMMLIMLLLLSVVAVASVSVQVHGSRM